jgi:hypothetical protein
MGIDKYFSQWDDCTWGGVRYTGLCFETCIKMVKYTLHHQEVPLQTIVANGDKNPNVTTIDGMKLTCSGNDLAAEYWYEATQEDLRKWINIDRRYVIAIVNYNKIPSKYKQDLGNVTGHAILLTHVADDGSVRYADPDFSGTRRNEGWYDNNKWIGWADFFPAFHHGMYPGIGYRNGTVLVIKEAKPVPTPPPVTPPIDPCATQNAQITELTATVKNRDLMIEKLNRELSDDTQIISDLRTDVKDLGSKFTESEKIVEQQGKTIEKLEEKLVKEAEMREILANNNADLTKKLTDQKADFDTRMKTAENQIKEYKDMVKPLTDTNSELTNKVTALETQVADLQIKTVQAVSSRVLVGELFDRLFRRG